MRQQPFAPFAFVTAAVGIAVVTAMVPSAVSGQPAGKEAIATDRYGIPLPKGAVMRFGAGWFSQPPNANLAFSPDGKFLVSTGYSDKLIRLWDPNTGRELRALEGHTSDNIGFAFSANGKWLASGNQTSELFLWEFGTGKVRRRFRGSKAPIHRLDLSPNGKVLATTCSERTLRLWDTDTGKEIHSLPVDKGYGVSAMTFAPDSKHFAYSDRYDKGIHLVDVATGKVIREFKGHTFHVRDLAFTADGATLLSSSDDNTLRAWDANSGKGRRLYDREKKWVGFLALSPDSKTLAFVAERLVHFRDLATNKDVLPPWHSSPGDAQSLAFSPDGKKLAVGGLRIALLDTATGKQLNPDPESLFHIRQIEYAAKGKVLAVWREDHTIELWDTAKGRKMAAIRPEHERDQFASLAADPTGNSLTTAIRHYTQGKEHGSICLWDPMTGKKQKQFSEKESRFESLSYTADGKTLGYLWLKPGPDTFVIRDTATGKQRRRFQASHHPSESDLRLSPDGRLLAWGAIGSSVELRDVKTGKAIYSLGDRYPRYPTVPPAFSPDGRTIATPGGRRREGQKQIETDIVLWEIATGKERLHIAPNEGQVSQIAFSPDGRLLATAGLWETIHLWDSWTGKEVGRFAGHRGRIHSLSFAPDGKTLASAGEDKTILIWDVSRLVKARRPIAEKLSREQLDRCWGGLIGTDAALAYAAIGELARYPGQAEGLLKDKIALLKGIDPARLSRLIAELDNDDFTTREKASKELANLGRLAEGMLRKTLDTTPTGELKRRIRELLNKLDAKVDGPKYYRLLRVIEVLERLGTAEARRLLRKLVEAASDPDTACEAQASLQRLAKPAR